jgi:hypothetical protein
MKTRVRELKDGSCEIIRLLSPDEMDAWSKDDPLSYEKSIVWTSDVTQLPAVHVKTVRSARSRRGPIYLGTGAHVVGYSKLTPNAPRDPVSLGYARRVFYVLEGGSSRNAHGTHVLVDPQTVLPGAAGKIVSSA